MAIPSGRNTLTMPLAVSDGTVEPSPARGERLALPSDSRVVALAVSRVTPRLVAVIENAGGQALIDWRVGKDARVLPIHGSKLIAIAFHPLRDHLFATGMSGENGVVMRIDLAAHTWNATRLWTAAKPVNTLAVSTLPFCLSGAFSDVDNRKPQCVHRLFFAEQGAAGWQVRSVSEDGRAAYLAIGPAGESFATSGKEHDAPPETLIAQNLRPIEFSPDGTRLHLIDKDNCLFVAQYGESNWAQLERHGKCNQLSRIAPNGLDAIEWTPGKPGIRIVTAGANASFTVAPDAKFDQFGGLTADGGGVFGVIGSTLAYVPIDYPLGDVKNAWQFRDLLAGESRAKIVADGGVFIPTLTNQLYESYEGERYAVDTWKKPEIVTTDVFWETASAAFHGVFSEIEQRQAIPAFNNFVNLAADELGSKFHDRRIVQDILASKAVLEGRSNDGAMALLNNPENKPRGNYEKNPAAQRYFVAMRSFVHAQRTSGDVEPLRHLSAKARAAADEWISAYRPFIGPSRLPLPYGEIPTGEQDRQGKDREYSVFPMSFGFDNRAIKKLIHGKGKDEMLSVKGEPRWLPSAVELAAIFGNKTAASAVTDSGAPAVFPALGARIAALTGEWHARPKPAALYELWLEAMGEEWREDGLPWLGKSWEAKRLQTGLAAWVSLRHGTILVNERMGAEGGEGGPEFERLKFPEPLGIVEPNPGAFEAISRLYDQLDAIVSKALISDESKKGMKERIALAKKDVVEFAAIARKEIKGTALSDEDNKRIRDIAGIAEYNFLVFLALTNPNGDGGITTPDPVPKIADVAGRPKEQVLLAAIGAPLKWSVAVPFSGRRQLVSGPVYSFHEFTAEHPVSDSDWRKMAAKAARPAWIQRHIGR